MTLINFKITKSLNLVYLKLYAHIIWYTVTYTIAFHIVSQGNKNLVGKCKFEFEFTSTHLLFTVSIIL